MQVALTIMLQMGRIEIYFLNRFPSVLKFYRMSTLATPFPVVCRVAVRVDFVSKAAKMLNCDTGPQFIIFLNAFLKFSDRKAYKKGFKHEFR